MSLGKSVTSNLTLLCPEGIVVAADMRETKIFPDWMKMKPETTDGVQKIYPLTKNIKVAISCWGVAEVTIDETEKKNIISYLAEFEKSKLQTGCTVDTVAAELKASLESLTHPIVGRMGFHIVGYKDNGASNKPQLRHVFQTDWHAPGKFTNEDCHVEYHDEFGNRVEYRIKREYPTLFNGDSLVANALFNYAPLIQPYYGILPHQLHLSECEELAKLIIGTSIERLDYFFDLRKFEKMKKSVGGGISMGRITEHKGFEPISQQGK